MRINSHNFRMDNLRQQFVLMALAYVDAGVINQIWVDVKDQIREQMGSPVAQLDDYIRWRALLGVTPR